MADNSKFIEKTGVVVESLPNTTFRVEIDNGSILLCHLSGKLRKFHIRILPGDEVQLEISPYDLTKGRITFRNQSRS